MHGALALVVALSVVSGEQQAVRSRQHQPPPATYHQYAGPSEGHFQSDGLYLEQELDGMLGGGSCCDGGCEDCHDRSGLSHYFWRAKGTCNMVERVWYFPEAHGYYYFRPYNHNHIAQHQNLASQWGVDPRNPYSNEMFERIYETVETRNLLEEVPSPGMGYPVIPQPPVGAPATTIPLPAPSPGARTAPVAREPVAIAVPFSPRKRDASHIRFVLPASHSTPSDETP